MTRATGRTNRDQREIGLLGPGPLANPSEPS